MLTICPPYNMENKNRNTAEYNYELLLMAWRHEPEIKKMIGNDLQVMKELAERITEDPKKYRNIFYLCDKYHKHLT